MTEKNMKERGSLPFNTYIYILSVLAKWQSLRGRHAARLRDNKSEHVCRAATSDLRRLSCAHACQHCLFIYFLSPHPPHHVCHRPPRYSLTYEDFKESEERDDDGGSEATGNLYRF